jgi:hypothetical protein
MDFKSLSFYNTFMAKSPSIFKQILSFCKKSSVKNSFGGAESSLNSDEFISIKIASYWVSYNSKILADNSSMNTKASVHIISKVF